MTLLIESVVVLLAAGIVASAMRCTLGFHGETLAEAVRAGDKRVPYTFVWRCVRCSQIVGSSVMRPNTKLMLDMHRDRRAADADGRTAARVLTMPAARRRA